MRLRSGPNVNDDERFTSMTATLAAPRPARLPRPAPCAGSDAREVERLLLVRYHEDGDLEARDLQERTLAVSRATEVLSTELGRSPKVREVAEHLGCSVEQVLEAQEAAASYEAASLDAPTARNDDESASLVELLGGEDSAYELVEDRDAIASTWLALPEVERQVLELRFMHDLTQREIGERIGYSQMHVSRLLRRALNRLETAAAAA